MVANEKTIGLALSGGGFRATLFHLGVIRFLHEAKLLKNVRVINSVSGGSVLGAHLVLNWHRYLDPDQFEAAAQEIIRLTKSDVRGKILRRGFVFSIPYFVWKLLTFGYGPWPRLLTRLGRFERFLSRLFRHSTLSDLKVTRQNAEPPLLNILATSFATGSFCSFSANGICYIETSKAKDSIQPDPADRAAPTNEVLKTQKTYQLPIGTIPIGFAVAASAAFPALFPPATINNRFLNAPQKLFPFDDYLTDGGVYDNLGLDGLREEEVLKKDVSAIVIVSDAVGIFDWAVYESFTFLPRRALRTIEILMKRVSDSVSLQAALHCKIRTEVASSFIDPSIQRKIAQIRTDFDVFSDEEIYLLIAHGYLVAQEALKQRAEFSELKTLPGAVGNADPWGPSNISRQQRLKYASKRSSLVRSHRTKWRLWSSKDWGFWFSALILGVFLASGVTFLRGYYELEWKKQQLLRKLDEYEEKGPKYHEACKVSAQILGSDTPEKHLSELLRMVYSDSAFSEGTRKIVGIMALGYSGGKGKVPSEDDRRRLAIIFARSCRRDLDDIVALDLIRVKSIGIRKDMYDRTTRVVGEIIEEKHYHAATKRITAFWNLYFAELPLIESSELEAAQVQFGDALNKWSAKALERPREVESSGRRLIALFEEEQKKLKDKESQVR
ncbi:MAG: patatin-like phospholipase family protein [Planctomycetes bacterium]|nr:patatin-like phospholipase family protein [Planctomycetota bacterium]